MSDNSYGDPPITDALVVHDRDLEWTTVYSWMRDGVMNSAWPGQGKNVPPDGTEIGVKLINFPVGSVRAIMMKTSARTHPHGSYEDVLFYQIGGRRVQMCEDESGLLNPGDVSFEPHGVEHSMYQLIAGPFVEFALPAPVRTNGRPVWMKSSEAREIDCAVWSGGTAEGPDAYWAPSEAKRHVRRFFSFPGHDLIETKLPAGCPTIPRDDVHDTLFYVVSGRLLADIGGTVTPVETGDSLRAPKGVRYTFTATDDSVLIQAAARTL